MATMRSRLRNRLLVDIKALRAEVDVNFDANPFRSLSKRFVIAAGARTGSNLLCERLLAHGAVVGESLLTHSVFAACKYHGTGLQRYCENYIESKTPGGVFGTKGSAALLAPLFLAQELPEFLGDWKFVYLYRVDVLKQAISAVIAKETLSWRSSRTPTRALSEEDFDGNKILTNIKISLNTNKKWTDLFELLSLEPFRVTYEDLAADPDVAAANVANYLGLPGLPITEKKFATPPLEVQATSVNTIWEEKYRSLGLPLPESIKEEDI